MSNRIAKIHFAKFTSQNAHRKKQEFVNLSQTIKSDVDFSNKTYLKKNPGKTHGSSRTIFSLGSAIYGLNLYY